MIHKLAIAAFTAVLLTIPACRSTPSTDCNKLEASYIKGDKLVQTFYQRFDRQSGEYLGTQSETAEFSRKMERDVLPELKRLNIKDPKLREMQAILVSDYQRFVQRTKTQAATPRNRRALYEGRVSLRIEGSAAWGGLVALCSNRLD